MTADRYVTEAREVRDEVQACPACGRLIKRARAGHMPAHYDTNHRWPCSGPETEKKDRWTPLARALLSFRCGSCGADANRWCRRADGYFAPLHAARFYSAGQQNLQPRPQLYPSMVHRSAA